ncbi:type II toxin-antitoxin system death-on-curing family toxin [Oscillatoria sp. CS-180]|uniref:type II toxin-antitoxin system death-on-curing family toxin n=1 Tax=Oscillatoria sp. CS-180 TaxID=3021720 RepID=UPI00232B8408|nr:type II toxin-antitoxin system death-on-curing family toxin [Oscillatoria sp. CS-180]MDB9525219.1 type II toxin-antitoxin system death-on-curing family toxin [Oscillatoria sp. CS-180]
MHYLTVDQVINLHTRIVEQSGGAPGLANKGALESAVAQPQMTFAGADLYSTIPEKACALGFSLIQNHPFIDGNKRIGHAAMEVFLVLNGHELNASVDEQEHIILQVASGAIDRDGLAQWLARSIVLRQS